MMALLCPNIEARIGGNSLAGILDYIETFLISPHMVQFPKACRSEVLQQCRCLPDGCIAELMEFVSGK